MIVVHDKIALGSIAGIIGTIPSIIFNYVAVLLGFGKFYSFQLTGSVHLFPGLTDYFWSLVFGGIIWGFLSMFLGIVTVYLLKSTGNDYWWLKGILVSMGIMFILIYGYMYTFGAARIVPFDLATNFSQLIENIMFGVFTAFLIVKCGKEII